MSVRPCVCACVRACVLSCLRACVIAWYSYDPTERYAGSRRSAPDTLSLRIFPYLPYLSLKSLFGSMDLSRILSRKVVYVSQLAVERKKTIESAGNCWRRESHSSFGSEKVGVFYIGKSLQRSEKLRIPTCLFVCCAKTKLVCCWVKFQCCVFYDLQQKRCSELDGDSWLRDYLSSFRDF